MAQITGSSTIDWSSITLQPVSVGGTALSVFSTFLNALTAIAAGNFTPGPSNTSTFFSGTLNLVTGATVTMTGAGLDQLTNPSASGAINTFEYNFGPDAHVVELTGVFDGQGSTETIHSFSDKASGVERAISGNILLNRSGKTTGTISEVKVTSGTTEVLLQGNMGLSGFFKVGGAVTQVSAVSGGDTIVMTGLSVPYSAFRSVTTIGDLFEIVGSRMPGDDLIQYTNNSGSGMTFFGGAGNDTITISGPNADALYGGAGNDTLNGSAGNNILLGETGNDILNGGDGNDTLIGGLGDDDLIGGDGDDAYVIGSGTDVLTENPNEGTDTVVSSSTHTLGENIENLTLEGSRAINGTGNELANILFGNTAANVLLGRDGNDTLIGGGGQDTLIGGAGQDSVQYSGLLSEYVLGTEGGMLTVTDRNRLNGNEGTDRVTEIEQLTSFSDATTLTVTRGELKVGGSRQDSAAVAGLANGGYVVTWTGGDGPFSFGISAQRYTAEGERVGGTTRVNTTTIGPQEDSAVAGLVNGGYVVTWTSSDVSASHEIYAQRYNAQGARVGSETRVNATTTGLQEDSAVAGLANGGYVVTWTATTPNFSDGIYAQRYTGQGVRVGGETLVNTTTDGSQGDSAVAGLANGGYVVIWASTDQTFSTTIYAQRYNAQGVPVDGETLASTTTGGSGTNGAVAGLADGGYVVTWTSADASSSGIHAQQYDALGVPVGSATPVNTTTAGPQDDSAVAGLADGGYIVTWKSSDTIYAQRYDALGVPVGGETLVDTTSSPQSGGAVAGLANGGYVVTWRAEDELFNFNTYAQPYDAQGDAVGGYVVTGTAGADQLTVGTQTLLTVDGAGGNDILTGGASADHLLGGDGNDVLSGGVGADTQQGGTGDDLFLLGSVGEFAAGEFFDGGADTDTLRYTGTAGTLILTSLVRNIEQVQIADAAGSSLGTGAVNINGEAVSGPLTITGNNGANVLTGTVFDDTLGGNGGNDTLHGSLGNDTINGGAGNDVLVGGAGDDTYQINSGAGQDRIVDNDDTSGNSDSLVYGAAIDRSDLILSRQVNDLRIAVQGTTDRVTIAGWYANPAAAQIETIQAGVGQTLLNSQVDQLIQAMAQFTSSTGVSWEAAAGGAGDATQQAQFQSIIAANWQ